MKTRTLGIVLAIWSFGFAGVHMAWAAGCRGGPPDSYAPSSGRPWFLAYDILAGLLMHAATVAGLAGFALYSRARVGLAASTVMQKRRQSPVSA
ncbi:hypothetical protein [Luteipulveratus mongoliensis]|uniref:Lipoprotein n=1 Tax=Luteipulveratus mongoliensis TaxID=571913 RepID=A0A0K1JGF2_9MICO|nr:hypothetical protein [Luteipulveratus mongoliensis]AKU15792.1 hypothetical protein VV02_07860 [Luteipulveratus mongoliensis]